MSNATPDMTFAEEAGLRAALAAINAEIADMLTKGTGHFAPRDLARLRERAARLTMMLGDAK